jgi:AcrR family transcriptional regulator
MGGMSEAGTEAVVPPELERLWRRRPAGRRGPRPALSVDRIVQAAVEIADAEGLAAVSMARVAESLGFTPMALYRHVSSKDELLVLMSDAVPGPPDIPADLGWRDALALWTRSQIELTVSRPWYLDLPLSSVTPGPRRAAWIDAAFYAMRDLVLPADEKMAITGLLAQHVLGETRVQVESRRTAAERVRRAAGLGDDVPESELDPAALDAANPYADFELILTRLASPEEFPYLAGALADWDPEAEGGRSTDDDVAFGINVILDGIEAWVARRGTEQR